MGQPGQQLAMRDPFQAMMFPFGGMSPFGNMFQNMVSGSRHNSADIMTKFDIFLYACMILNRHAYTVYCKSGNIHSKNKYS